MEEKRNRLPKCHWCGNPVVIGPGNLVHVGGLGEIYGCDKCLDLKPIEPKKEEEKEETDEDEPAKNY